MKSETIQYNLVWLGSSRDRICRVRWNALRQALHERWIESAFVVIQCGAVPVFADIDLETRLIDPEAVRGKIGPRTRCVITVHMSGMPCDMDTFMALGAETGVKILEDCAQAHGARYKGRRCGGMGDAGAFSFYFTKNLGAFGDAGAVTSSDEELLERAQIAAPKAIKHLMNR